MKRPALTKKRIDGILALADFARNHAAMRPGSAFGFPRNEVNQVRAAIEFADDLGRWRRERERERFVRTSRVNRRRR